MEEIKQTVAYYNAGIEAGITLNDDQQSLIDDYIDNFKTSASSEGVSLDEYLQENVGDYCTESTLRLFYEQYFISSAYQGYYRATQTVTDEQVNEYFENNSSDYYQINFSYLAVEYDETDDTTAAESQATVEGYINQITDRDSILALVPTVYKDYIDQDVESAMESDSTLSEEDATEEAIAVYEQSIDATISASSSPFDDDFNDWLFSDDTPIGSTNYYVDSSIGYAYIILKTEQPTLSEDDTYTVRHILVTPETDDEDRASDYDFTDEEWAAALEKANEIVSEYNSGDKTELSFALLAEKYSDDTASTVTGLQGYYGGLYEDVTEGTMTSEFQNWALDESRVYGDTEIVKSSYGYHIMYFINHVPSYQASIISQIKDDAVEASIEDCNLKTHTSVLNKAVDKYYASKSTSTDD
jgi:parvulin-like peptidyl-prolyl isomerase